MIQARHREVQSLELFLRTRFAPIGISSTFLRWSLTAVEVLLCGLGMRRCDQASRRQPKKSLCRPKAAL